MAEPQWDSRQARAGEGPRVRGTQQPFQSYSGRSHARESSGPPIGLAIGAIVLILKLIVAVLSSK